MPKYNIAIVGSATRTGTELVEILSQRDFPLDNLYLLDDEEEGKKLKFDDELTLSVYSLTDFDFKKADIVFCCESQETTKKIYEQVISSGALLIDGSSLFKEDYAVPMIIPEVNLEEISNYKNKGVIVSPNCVSIGLITVINNLYKQYGIKRLVVSTYQSVSGVGNDGLEELFEQTKGVFLNDPISKTKKAFTKQIAFNVIPHIGVFLEDGTTEEEKIIEFEVKKILSSEIELSVSAVRVPVFIGHSMNVNIEFEEDYISIESVREILKNSSGVVVVDYRADEGYVSPVECAGEDSIYVSRIREDKSKANSINLWISYDNLRKGRALNMLQIAEAVIQKN